MIKHKIAAISLLNIMALFSLPTVADITPYIVETQTLYFGNVIFVPGSCQMAYDTQVISNLTVQNICATSLGTTGGYRIFANPNKQVQIKINSHTDSGNGIIYVPDGQLSSDVENTLVIADTTETINSGTSGIIDITLGGRLTINSTLSSLTLYNELYDIEFNEL